MPRGAGCGANDRILPRSNGIEGLAVAFVVGNAAATPYDCAVARTSFRDEPAPPVDPAPAPWTTDPRSPRSARFSYTM